VHHVHKLSISNAPTLERSDHKTWFESEFFFVSFSAENGGSDFFKIPSSKLPILDHTKGVIMTHKNNDSVFGTVPNDVFPYQSYEEALAELNISGCGCVSHDHLEGYVIKRGDALLWERDNDTVPWDEGQVQGLSKDRWYYIPF
jgi:hypothetical protein